MSKVQWTVLDYSGERSGFSLYIPDIDETNWVATNASIQGLNTAIAALTLGNITRVGINHDTGLGGADVLPSNPRAQRELGVRFFYTDTTTGDKGNFTVPAVDTSIVAQQGTDLVDLTLSIVAAIVTAFEALAVSKAGNAIQVTSGRIVGRRN